MKDLIGNTSYIDSKGGIACISFLKPDSDELQKEKRWLLKEFDTQDGSVADLEHAILEMSSNAIATEALLCELDSCISRRAVLAYKLAFFGFDNPDDIRRFIFCTPEEDNTNEKK